MIFLCTFTGSCILKYNMPSLKALILHIKKKGGNMIVRLTFLGFSPEKIGDMKKFYNEEAIPTVKKQKGNIDCRLLEPADRNDEYISMTVWDNQEDADAYNNTGVYKKLVDQVRPYFIKEPVLKVYQAQYIMEHA